LVKRKRSDSLKGEAGEMKELRFWGGEEEEIGKKEIVRIEG
jgi:hypothetical protein